MFGSGSNQYFELGMVDGTVGASGGSGVGVSVSEEG